MKKISIALTIAAVLVLTALPVFAQGAPKLVIAEKVIDLGEVAQGEVSKVVFELRNEGDKTLTVRSVRPTCGCTVAEYDKEISAGGKGSIRATLDTAGFKGAIAKSIMVMSDDGQNPTTVLVIKALVQPYIEIMPRALVRFNVLQQEEAKQKVVIAATERSGKFKITGAEADSEFLEVTFRSLQEDEMIPGKPSPQYELAVQLSSDAPVGPLSSVITVKTSAKKAEKLEIKVFGVVRALLRVTPPELQFGVVEARMAPARNVIVVNNRPGSPIEITKAVVNDPAFTTEIIEIEKGKRHQVTVTVKRTAAGAGIKNAILTLTTTDAETPELTVPVKANLR
ncbi:MAG: DUF1573 domain-containing protein [Thermoanaerobaculales bacterium]|nr:DUF1573 domain-containing protein [Thermoanaerobaculales bacterium]